ncbi:MAG TPA: nitronate monooxygenase [Ottowia sp.]|uniref:NAD(P)H-dependent flavin oxidoreductase n=1 Tax=Ottowia sp. TaxID=1898956 RepID=UPI002BB9C1A5|nr:nitronate monooxygenase [Ottowia sp.]HMN20983.1 nitronate monooxygenase [Ottowia sp.]
MPSFPLTDRLELRWSLLQAPMAGAQDSALALAVSGAGGLGALPCALLAPEALRTHLERLATSGLPYNVNWFCHTPPTPDAAREAAWRAALKPYYDELGLDLATITPGGGRVPFSPEAAEVMAEFRPPVVSFHYGLPAPELLARVKSWGAFVLSSATTVREALWLEAHGADAIIAQGLEAGGHRGHFLSDDLSEQMGSLALLPQVVATVRLPVIAAGGIANAAGVRAALALGASGVQVGTAYLCADEALTQPAHRAALQSEAARHTVITNLISGRPARGIPNRLMRELGPISDVAPAFPLAGAALVPLRTAAEQQSRHDFTHWWCGQNASGCRSAPAAEITRALAQGFD